MTSGPSLHLSWEELACKDGTPYPQEWRDNRALKLSTVFEIIRAECGHKPIRVTSAYRTPEHNRKKEVGGRSKSQHLFGRALDLIPPKGMTVKKFYRIIRELANTRELGIRGIGRYKKFVHVDIRPSSRLAVWTGKKVDLTT